MSEVKSVKVDNWGVFFLQKLQNFFNKTDYCDLTLQFNDNSQLKVHRLVLSACTDYFNVLEQTCEMIDDILVMPRGLQADVVVPIVNFMYTGTLEFEINMYGRLLRTAKDMNMTVLLKLLEAHKRTVEGTRPQKYNRMTPIKTLNRYSGITPQKPQIEKTYQSPSTSLLRRNSPATTIQQYKSLQIKPYSHSKTVKGPSRFDDDNILPAETFESSFDTISYESKPLITANQICKEETELEDYDVLIPKHDTSTTFEALRRSYTNNKRPSSSVSSFESPPEKKPNIQDVKEYAEQQRMRKQIAAEYDDENEYDDVLDDEYHNDDDDEDYVPPPSFQKQNRQTNQSQKLSTTVKMHRDQKPTIVVKDTAGSNVNHAKIISEVLKKYPHLVKNNKNIKLKIMAKSNSSASAQKIIIKQEHGGQVQETPKPPILISKNVTVKPVASKPAPVQAPPPVTAPAPQPAKPAPAAPRRIDSKTMHALIAQGAENTTGPWLCLRCGVNGRPISIPSYRGFRRHLINTHKEKVDPRLCEHCGWRSPNNRRLYYHMKIQHSIKPPYGFDFPICEYCSEILFDEDDLEAHIQSSHPEKAKEDEQQCMYCNKSFNEEMELYHHMRAKHKERAQEDGVLEFSDEESEFEGEKYLQQHAGEVEGSEKIKILSDIPLPKASVIPAEGVVGLEPSSEAEALNNVATGIAASLGLIDSSDGSDTIQYITTDMQSAGPKFVNADGNLMELTEAQREEIISQLDNQHGEVVMVLNQESFETTEEIAAAATAADTESETATTETNSNMLVMFNESQAKKERKTSAGSTSKKNENDQGEWEKNEEEAMDTSEKENEANKKESSSKEVETSEEKSKEKDEDHLTKKANDKEENKADESKDDVDEEESEKPTPKDTEDKLKLLTGDWSEDEEEEEETSEKKGSKPTTKPSIRIKDKEQNSSSNTDGAEDKNLKKSAVSTKTPEKSPKTEEKTEEEEEDIKPEEEESKDEELENTETKVEETDDSKDLEEKDEADADDLNKSSDDGFKKETDTGDAEETEKSNEKETTKTDSTATEENPKKSEGESEAGSSAVITKDEIRNLISDWGDDEEEEL